MKRRPGCRVLYVSGEESEAQTAMRAERLGQATDALQIMTATELGTIWSRPGR